RHNRRRRIDCPTCVETVYMGSRAASPLATRSSTVRCWTGLIMQASFGVRSCPSDKSVTVLATSSVTMRRGRPHRDLKPNCESPGSTCPHPDEVSPGDRRCYRTNSLEIRHHPQPGDLLGNC